MSILLLTFFLACIKSQIGEADPVQYVEVEKCANIIGHKACDIASFNSLSEAVNLHDLEGKPFVLDLSAL